jgi:hypothetical protein
MIICGTAHILIPKILPARNHGPNIMVIAADSLRNDRLGANKYFRHLTPNIDKVAAGGTVFNKAYTSLARTFPAIVSFLTGQLPVSHGIRDMFPNQYIRDQRNMSLVETLRQRGYANAVVSDYAGDVFSAMFIGFEKIRAPFYNFNMLISSRSLEIHFLLMPYITNHAGRALFPELRWFNNNSDPFYLADETIDALAELTRKDKFFCFVFFSNTHLPYASPYPYYQKYTLPSYSGAYKYNLTGEAYLGKTIKPADAEQINAVYDGSVEAFDTAAGKILDYLKKRGCLDNTIVIITADHGENLFDYDWFVGHGDHLRGDKNLNVPLIISFPKAKYVKKVNCLTRDIDVAPTLCEYLGLEIPKGTDGQSLMPLLEGKKEDLGLFAFAETGIWFTSISGGFFQKERIMYPRIEQIARIDNTCNNEIVMKNEYEDLVNTAKHRMVDDGRYRLIYVPLKDRIKYELYDKENDKQFANDLSSKNPAKVTALKKKLFEFMGKDKNIVFKDGFAVPKKQ